MTWGDAYLHLCRSHAEKAGSHRSDSLQDGSLWVLGFESVSLPDRAFDLVHMDRSKLVFECLLGT